MATWKLSKSDVILLMAFTAPFIKSANLSGLCSSRCALMLTVQTKQRRVTNSPPKKKTPRAQSNVQRGHLRLHVVLDVELVGFFGESGWLQVVIEDDVDVRDGAFFRALVHLLGGRVGPDE